MVSNWVGFKYAVLESTVRKHSYELLLTVMLRKAYYYYKLQMLMDHRAVLEGTNVTGREYLVSQGPVLQM